tara:strand:+ start:13300 stop:13758 length:459 start_codon:yes stop_codon:yes gene_type:complete
MKKLKSFKLFEAIYTSIIGILNYTLVYDPTTKSAWFKFTAKSDEEDYEMEIKSNGIHKDKKIRELRVFAPQNIKFNFDDFVDKFTYIANKNRLKYKFDKKEVVNPKYGLQPYAIILIVPILNDMEELERILASTKSVNSKIKKGGNLDQFTF